MDDDPAQHESDEDRESAPDHEEEEDEDDEDMDGEDFEYVCIVFHEDIVLFVVLIKLNVKLLHCVERTLRAKKPEMLCAR